MLPFLIVSQLLLINFIYPSCIRVGGFRATGVVGSWLFSNACIWWRNDMCWVLPQVEASIFVLRYWICCAAVLVSGLLLFPKTKSWLWAFSLRLLPLFPPSISFHPQSVQAIPSPTDVPIAMPPRWKSVWGNDSVRLLEHQPASPVWPMTCACLYLLHVAWFLGRWHAYCTLWKQCRWRSISVHFE